MSRAGIFVCCLVALFNLTPHAIHAACNGTSAQSVEQNGNPLYFTSSSKDGWKLLVPESVTATKRMVYNVAENKVLLISCPGSRKTHFQSDKPSFSEYNFAATCKRDKLEVDRQNLSFTIGDAFCDQPLKIETKVLTTVPRECPSDKWLQVGFSIGVPSERSFLNQFVPFVELCHSSSDLSTLFAKHTWVPSPAVQMRASTHWSTFQNQATQAQIANFYQNNRDVQKAHLVPEIDFNYRVIRDCANYDENSAPIAKSFVSTWKSLENYLRKLTDTAIIYTGASSGEVEAQNYLDQDRKRVRIPDYLWKIIHFPNTSGRDFAVVGISKKQGNANYLDKTLADEVKTGTAVMDKGVQIGSGSLFKHSIEFIKRKFPEAINILS